MSKSSSEKKTSNQTQNTSVNAIGGGTAVSTKNGNVKIVGLTGKDAVGIATIFGQTQVNLASTQAAEFAALLQTASAVVKSPSANNGNFQGDAAADAPHFFTNPIVLLGGAAVVATILYLRK